MATLDSLKRALREEVTAKSSSQKQPLSDTQYNAGFEILMNGSESMSYKDFIIPQLSELLVSLLKSRAHISVLEIGPGSKSVVGHLPMNLKRRFRRYAAFEPNLLSATRLKEWFESSPEVGSPLPRLESPPEIYSLPFNLDGDATDGTNTETSDDEKRFDLVIFCHSMYGMKPKEAFILRALELLVKGPEGGIVVVFHRVGDLNLEALACDRTAIHPTGTVTVVNDDEILSTFAPFIAGFVMQDAKLDTTVRGEWIKICRAMTCNDKTYPGHLSFSSPQIMVTFTRNAIKLPELMAQVPLANGNRLIKSWEARLHSPASIFRPTGVHHVHKCIEWALKHKVGLTVLGGGHSGHCLWPNVVSVDMSAFDQVHIVKSSEEVEKSDSFSHCPCWVIVEAGCKTEDIIRKTMAAGVTVPLGSRPSLGAGLWLQGGIGHLSRFYGLACDNIIGAVMVSVESGQIVHLGQIPTQYVPAGSIRPKNERDLLWALKGAGTNFGVVISVNFRANPAPMYSVRNWYFPLKDNTEARIKLREFDKSLAKELSRDWSIDAYLYWETNQLHLGVTMYEAAMAKVTLETPTFVTKILGLEKEFKIVDGVRLFDTEFYMSGMHGGHSGKTSSLKRCLFLKDIGESKVADILISAIQSRPSPFCYLHLLQGGGVIGDVAAENTAFGSRDWEFACVVTGVWPRHQNGSEAALNAVKWVYNVASDLLPVCSGVYGADLGADPRDTSLADKAFGPNLERLARLKHDFDPYNVLAYACPLPKPQKKQKLIILVTGHSGAGKDYCANVWVSTITKQTRRKFTALSVSISDVTKQEYARATGADLNQLLSDRAYKEQHRPALTKFFQDQVCKRPQLPAEHFRNLVESASDSDVLLITGMRDEAPLAAFSHLAPDSRMLEVRIETSQNLRRIRQGLDNGNEHYDQSKGMSNEIGSNLATLPYRPSLIFDNERAGEDVAEIFAKRYLLPFLDEELQQLAKMVHAIPDFPRPGIEFRHVLNIAQQPGGLALCTSLLQSYFHDDSTRGDWTKVNALACCEAGGYIFASALGVKVNVPLLLIREAGKLPQPTVSVMKSTSHISSTRSSNPPEKMFEMNRDSVRKGSSVVIVDDVLATGRTLCAMIQLLLEAGVRAEDLSVMVVAEFPIHRGREILHQRGFGDVKIQSLLVFDGA
ncbi:hypothetical protein DSL72_008307 [Monilinia vaccinii-corymbosi]|uniref:FAD-binding PCMH-type domain-containing protein n=1 Tax=Monilinia vaccinii-corymbosi TaxID=61207 RepID=A0A8A3PJ99_9HELO|nr:hypothetical protein DSL72_008307 [Monilinia vaccinii-corymbosi]